MTLPVWAQDTVLALFVAYFQIAGTRRVAPSQEVAQLAHPAELGYLLLAVAGMALLLRRRWPLAVFFTTAAISLVYYVAGYPDGPGWIALFVAAYTVTARGDGQRSVQIVGGTILLLTLVWLLTADLTPIETAGRGIVGMRERAALLSGELAAGPGPDGGFQVWARLPLEPEGAAPG